MPSFLPFDYRGALRAWAIAASRASLNRKVPAGSEQDGQNQVVIDTGG